MDRHKFPRPEPSIDLGMAGLQTTTSSGDTPAGSGLPTSATASRAKPKVPQKKSNLEELVRLRNELEEVRGARDEAHGQRDAMEDDLLKSQDDLEMKDKELTRLAGDVNIWKEKANDLSRQALQARRTAGVAYQTDQETAVQQDQTELHRQLAQVQESCRSRVAEEKGLREAAEATLVQTKEDYEVKLRDIESQARAHMEVQQQQLLQAQTELQGQTEKMDVDFGSNGDVEHLRKVNAELETRINEQYRCTEQFKRMSERLTSEVRQAKQAEKSVPRPDTDWRQAEAVTSRMNTSLRSQPQMNMPGSFSQRH